MHSPANPAISHQEITSASKFVSPTKSNDARSGSVTLLGLGFMACLITLCAGTLHAADNSGASLKAGDEFLSKQDYDHAMTEYDAAVKQADSPGMKSLSLGKKGEVYLAQKNYTAAKQAADEALTVQELAPVAKVIALKVPVSYTHLTLPTN